MRHGEAAAEKHQGIDANQQECGHAPYKARLLCLARGSQAAETMSDMYAGKY